MAAIALSAELAKTFDKLETLAELGETYINFFFGCGNSFLYGLNTLQQRAPLQETHARGVLTRDVRTGYVKYSSD